MIKQKQPGEKQIWEDERHFIQTDRGVERVGRHDETRERRAMEERHSSIYLIRAREWGGKGGEVVIILNSSQTKTVRAKDLIFLYSSTLIVKQTNVRNDHRYNLLYQSASIILCENTSSNVLKCNK